MTFRNITSSGRVKGEIIKDFQIRNLWRQGNILPLFLLNDLKKIISDIKINRTNHFLPKTHQFIGNIYRAASKK